MLKKIALCLVLCALLCCLYAAVGQAEGYTLPTFDSNSWHDENDDYHVILYNTQMLCDGDTIHFLVIEDHYEVRSSTETFSAACYVFDADGNFVECSDHCGDVFKDFSPYKQDLSMGRPYEFIISAQNQTYFFTFDGKILQWQPGESEPWKAVVQLDFSTINTDYTFRNEEPEGMFTCMIDRNTLYGAFRNEWDGYTIQAFDLADGSRREVAYVNRITYLYPAQEGRILACCSPKATGYLSYYLIDVQNGELEKLRGGLSTMHCSGLVSDGNGGWYYASLEGTINFFTNDDDEGTVAVYPKPKRTYGGAGEMLLSPDGTRAYLLVETDSRLTKVFYDIDLTAPLKQAAENPVETLVIDGISQYVAETYGNLPAFSGFAAEKDYAVQVKMQKKLKYPKAISQAFIMKNDSFDAIILHTSEHDMDNLYEKGYYVDLADREEIVAYFDKLYPVWRNECMRDGKIIAFPVRVGDDYQFMYNVELFEMLGLSVPKTHMELFDAIEEWHAMGILDEYPLFIINGNRTRSYNHLFDKLLGDYMLLCDQAGITPDFTDEHLITGLERLDSLRDMLDAHDAQHLSGTPLLDFCGYPTGLANEAVHDSYGTYEPMPLGYGLDNQTVMHCSLAVMVVNPYSKHAELVKDYIAWMAQHPTPITQHVLLEGKPEGMETEISMEMRREWETEASEAKTEWEAAQASVDEAQIQAAGNKYAAIQDRMPQAEWLVRPDKARQLYQVLPDAWIRDYHYYQLFNNSEKAIDRYLAGEMDVRELLKNLKEVMWMMQAE